MQEIVADTINDLEFLKLQLTTEIDGIKNGVKSLENFEAVQKYIALKQEIDETSNIIKSIELIKKVEKLRDTYTEVKQYETTPITIKYYQQKLEYLENLISVNGIIYNKEREDKIFYSKEEVLKHLISLKEQAGLSSNLTIEELNRYIDNVRKTLQAYNHYEDDKVVDEILSYKVYQNPQNYDIKIYNTQPYPLNYKLDKNKDHRVQTPFLVLMIHYHKHFHYQLIWFLHLLCKCC